MSKEAFRFYNEYDYEYEICQIFSKLSSARA